MTNSTSKVPPLSLSKYAGIWRSGSESDKADDALYENPRTTEQKNLSQVHNDINRAESPLALHPRTPDEISAHLKNGGKSCHPKMRAKFMFRTGDFETCDWGYDWSSSDNESLNKGFTGEKGGHAPVIKETSARITDAEHSPLKRKRSDSVSEHSSICSETTIPAVDELGSPITPRHLDWIMCPVLKNNNDEKTLYNNYDDSMPILANVSETPLETPKTPDVTNTKDNLKKVDPYVTEVTEKLKDFKEDIGDEKEFISKKPDDDVCVLEITCDDVTVIFQECQRPKGFFKWQD